MSTSERPSLLRRNSYKKVKEMNIKFRIALILCLGVFLFSLTVIPRQAANALGTPAEAINESGLATQAGAPIYKYLIHLGTGGPVACGDSLTPLYVGRRTGDVKKDAATALKSLFATGKYSGGLYNPLAASKLRVRRVEYNPANKKYQVFLGGRLVKPKTYCDIARARAIVWATAQQFPEVRHATIWLGSGLLGDLLAAKERAKQ
jgi:hypothetical protein